jgi:UDP-N-acetylglucosamine 2-epimerase (non-hydrolysing)
MSQSPANVLCVIGTRPEAIKLAPVVRAIRAEAGHFRVRLCVTAQHRDLLDPLLQSFDLRPDHDLNLMRTGQSLPELTAALFGALGPVLAQERPDWVLIQGDTTSALVAAMTACYAGARVAHVEAGLRTGRIDQPFPEELNRLLIARIADLHFAPTERARANLLAEGIDEARVFVTGNTSIDALQWTLARTPQVRGDLVARPDTRVVFVTLHRRESFGAPLERMCDAVATLAGLAGPGTRFVCTVHPNPNVSEPMRRVLGAVPNVVLIDPLDYPATVALLARCAFVMTDSGGLQEEAPALGKPVLVLRDTTERPEGVEAGVARLVGRESVAIVDAAMTLLQDPAAYARMARMVSPYGDGHAAERIARALLSATGQRRD